MNVQRLYGKGHHPLLWVGLRDALGHITRGVPKCLNYYEIFIVYTQFTNVVSGRILQLGGPHARIRDLWCRNNSTKKIVYSEFQDLHFSPNITSSWDSAVWLDVAGILV